MLVLKINHVVIKSILWTGIRRNFKGTAHVIALILDQKSRFMAVLRKKQSTLRKKKPVQHCTGAGVRTGLRVADWLLLRAGFGVFQHPANRHNQHAQHRRTNQQRDRTAGEQIRQHIQLVSLHVATDQTRRQVTQRTGAEPQPHHLAAHSLRCQQRHGRQTLPPHTEYR